MEIRQESIFVPLGPLGKEKLHLERFFPPDESGPPPAPAVFMLHGAIENARIFYSKSGKGLAPFLARAGFNVFAADLRGRGASEPRISRDSRYGQLEAITEDLPSLIGKIREIRGRAPEFWIAHSWGGVLMMSALARFPELVDGLRGMVFFGTKRSVRSWTLERLVHIEFFWKFFGRVLVKIYGYLPAARFGWGSDNETDLSHLESKLWVKRGPWVDPRDGFDYGKAIREVKLPPILNIAGSADRCLGNPRDVRDFMNECAAEKNELVIAPGFNHVDLLTSPRAEKELFATALNWMRGMMKAASLRPHLG